MNHKRCAAFKYLQRINFFDKAGLKLPEAFVRKADSANFIPLRELSPNVQDIGPIATRMAKCVAPEHMGEEVFRLLQYATSEAMLNCKQHSRGRGFVAAQYAQKHDLARIAVADCGRGILASFRENESPHEFPSFPLLYTREKFFGQFRILKLRNSARFVHLAATCASRSRG